MEPVELVQGDHVDLLERLIVAPIAGIFSPCAAPAIDGGTPVAAGQVLGAIDNLGGPVEVVVATPGLLMGMLVRPGERVRDRQPLAWLRIADPADATTADAP